MLSFSRFTPVALVTALMVGGLVANAAEPEIQLPSDTQAMMRINFRSIIDSPLAKKMGIEKSLEFIKTLPGAELLKELGFNPLKDIDSITFVAPGGGDSEKSLIILSGKFKADKLVAKATEEAKNNKETVKISKTGDKTIFEVLVPDQQVPMFVMIASNSSIVASTNKEYLIKAIGGTESKLSNKDFSSLVGKLDPKLSISMVAVSAAVPLKSIPEGARGIVEGIESIGGGFGIDTDVTLAINVYTKDDESAKKLKETMDGGMAQALGFLGLMAAQQKELIPALEFLKSIKVNSKGKMVGMEGKLPGKVIEEALKGSTK